MAKKVERKKEESKIEKEESMKGKGKEKEFEVEEEDLVAAIDSLNDALPEDEQIVIHEGKGKNKTVRDLEELVAEFKAGIESLDAEDVPEDAMEYFQNFAEEKPAKKGKGKEKDEPEEEKGEEKDESEEEKGEEKEDCGVSSEDLIEAIETLNKSDLASEEVVVYEGKGKNKVMRDMAELVSEFMTACESVPQEKEDKLDDMVSDTYNTLSEVIKEKEKAAKNKKAAKKETTMKDKKEKDPKKVEQGKRLAAMAKEKQKGENGSPYSKDSSGDVVYQMIYATAKDGATLAELIKNKAKKAIESSDVDGRIKAMANDLVKKERAIKKGEKYIIVKKK
jgi:hypothetical protein